MVFTFVSNYINHHQLPFCVAMSNIQGINFHFIQTMPMEQKRIEMGWSVSEKEYPFISLFYEEQEKCEKLILESDVTILGWTDGMISDLERRRLSSGKLTFRVSERIYREGQWKFISPKGLLNKYREHIRYRKKPAYLLCAGAYVASDFALIGSYPGKKLKWGYFPEMSKDDSDKPALDDHSKIKLCWAGRLIDLKHPEFAVMAAKRLKEKGYDFNLDIIGDGYLKDKLEGMVADFGLSEEVTLHGAMSPKEVRGFMKKAHVFLFTSNYLEGWGAVVNEAMGCGCSVVASYEAGAVPFLVQDKVNGLSYPGGSFDEFMIKLLYLFENRGKIREFGLRARSTIFDLWNAEHAAGELVRFCREYYDGEKQQMAAVGPMSCAEVIKAPGFLRSIKEKNRLE